MFNIKKFKIYIFFKNIYLFLKMLSYNFRKNYYDENNQPIFLIGTNRSGSSLISSILRQHPDLRSLSEEVVNFNIKKRRDHTIGFSEDFIWQHLENFYGDHHREKNEGYLWGHPKYLRDFFIEKFWLKNSLIYEIYKINSKKIPFVKHSFFSLRLKLIKQLFPNAKIILNIRSYKDFTKSNYDKWSRNLAYTKTFDNNKPDIGLHWYLINTIAIYHCEKYFKNQYQLFHHEKLYDPNFDNKILMDELTSFLNIKSHDFTFENVNPKYKFKKDITFEYLNLKDVVDIAKFENQVYSDHNNE